VRAGPAESAAAGASEAPQGRPDAAQEEAQEAVVAREAAEQLVPGLPAGQWVHLHNLRVHAGKPNGLMAAILIPGDAGASAPGPFLRSAHPPETCAVLIPLMNAMSPWLSSLQFHITHRCLMSDV
jgi:hypothetical protein